MRQARGDRLFPGEGALDLEGLLHALPADLPVSVEIPIDIQLAEIERPPALDHLTLPIPPAIAPSAHAIDALAQKIRETLSAPANIPTGSG